MVKIGYPDGGKVCDETSPSLFKNEPKDESPLHVNNDWVLAYPSLEAIESKQRFYFCEHRWNGWYCTPTNTYMFPDKKTVRTFCTRLVPVPKYVPSFLEKTYVSYTVTQENVNFGNASK